MEPSNEVVHARDIELRFHGGLDGPPPATDHVIYVRKDAAFVGRVDAVLERVNPRRMVEIGVLDGGSTAYWHYKYELERLAAFDISADAPALTRYLNRNGLTDAVRVHFGVAQDNRRELRTAIENDFADQPLDAVIDDASHRYAETKATFETVFPYLRPGGAYLIEDWVWGHSHKWPPDLWADRPLMSPFLCELMLVCGHQSGVIDKVEIDQSFAVAWRGSSALPTDGSFELSAHYVGRGFSVAL